MKSDRIKNWPKEERPRERLLAEGADKLTEAELLAIILRVGQGTFKEGDVGTECLRLRPNPSEGLSGLRGLDRAHVQDLLRFPASDPRKSLKSRPPLNSEKGLRRETDSLLIRVLPGHSRPFRPRFKGKRQEIVAAVFLNGQNQRLGEKDITEGTPTQATVYVRRVIEEALRLSAAAVVLVHNHPSGNPEPSAGDDETTRDLLKACKLVQLVLLDHVIVGESEHYSYSDAGRLKELENE